MMKMDRAILLLKMMSNPIRLGILDVLVKKGGENICVGQIEDMLKISQSSVSQHLAHLRNSGFITCDKFGKKVCYSIADEAVIRVLKSLDLED